ncbi:hypothetical protein PFICI_00338 [Pestalotiopsis fici W106-1]|uniref:Uncharacterized protein n=1 Tax=Pestalotiopsis fici (strain W106-1 / CGMCC3.15140) TaxID=1229662 RepID=W3XKH7_PESFW|nr:uncharacterized protein PFICI_00338 [Pestalotiopsis fici W106-1]ETS86510.1 hypothetical protein PFICI_00338 [Pestalotiopsis fici W106-1]
MGPNQYPLFDNVRGHPNAETISLPEGDEGEDFQFVSSATATNLQEDTQIVMMQSSAYRNSVGAQARRRGLPATDECSEPSSDRTSCESSMDRQPMQTTKPNDTPLLGIDYKDSPLPLKDSVGIYGCAGIAGGSIFILAAVAFLTFLWFGHGTEPEAAGAAWLWRKIALEDWMTRTVTICALALRVAVSMQSGICTSMTAALVLENGRAITRKSQVAHTSVLRAINNGPRKLIQILIGSHTLSVLACLEFWLICLLGGLTLVLQFSSTVLLSDVRDFAIVGDDKVANISILQYNPSGDSIWVIPRRNAALLNIEPRYGVFGEERSERNSTPELSGFSNTDVVQRGYIPIPDMNARNLVRHYRGNALVSSSRIGCVPADIDATFENVTADMVPPMGSLKGTLNYGKVLNRTFPGTDAASFCSAAGCESTAFDCSIGAADESQASALCFVGDTTTWPHGTNLPWNKNSWLYLLFATNMTEQDLYDLSLTYNVTVNQTRNEWGTTRSKSGHALEVSMCLASFDVDMRFVDMSAKGPPTEPTLSWNPLQHEHDSSLVLQMFDTDSPKSPMERGLLDMQILDGADDWFHANHSQESKPSKLLSTIVNMQLSDESVKNTTYVTCIYCQIYGDAAMHPELLHIVEDTLQLTGRPAKALSNLYGAMGTTLYDVLLNTLNVTEEAHVASAITVRVPGYCNTRTCSGFTSVVTMLGVHLATVWLIATLYATRIRHSRISNIWHTVSQLFGDELNDALLLGNNTTDETVNERFFRKEQDALVRIGLAAHGSAIEVVSSQAASRKLPRHGKQ